MSRPRVKQILRVTASLMAYPQQGCPIKADGLYLGRDGSIVAAS